jgi:hypothetical protein
MATSGFRRSWVHIHSIIPRALCQRATQNIDMAVEPEEGEKLAHGHQQPTLPVRAKTRRQTITPDGTPGSLCLSNPGRRQTAMGWVTYKLDEPSQVTGLRISVGSLSSLRYLGKSDHYTLGVGAHRLYANSLRDPENIFRYARALSIPMRILNHQ